MDHTPEHEARPPAWAWVLLGWLGGRAIEAWLPSRDAPPVAPECTLELAEPAPAGPAPRELRAIPDVGEARALALARAFWERGGVGFDLTEIPGIGPASAARVREWLDARDRDRRE